MTHPQFAAAGERLVDRLSVKVRYRALTGQPTLDTSTGKVTRPETTATVRAVRRDVTQREVSESGGTLAIGDRVYRFRKSAIAGTPSTADRMEDEGDSWEVVSWRSLEHVDMWRVHARRVA